MGHRLSKYKRAEIDGIASWLVNTDTPIPELGPSPHVSERLRRRMFRASNRFVDTPWGQRLPSPEASLRLFDNLVELTPHIGRLAARTTIDDFMGCWSLPLTVEHRADGTSRYPSISNPQLGLHGLSGHRYVWKVLIDSNIRRGDYLDHLCRAHACCNPTHLEVTTSSVNTLRGNHARTVIGGQNQLF